MKDDTFSFADCNFAIQKSKETCGRVVMHKEFNLINSFTLEASFMGPTKGVFAGLHFNTSHMQMIGRSFCESLAEYVRDEDRVWRVEDQLNRVYPQGGTGGREGATITEQHLQQAKRRPPPEPPQDDPKPE